jgi:hypothetical protein
MFKEKTKLLVHETYDSNNYGRYPYALRTMHYIHLDAAGKKPHHLLSHFGFAPIREVLSLSTSPLFGPMPRAG